MLDAHHAKQLFYTRTMNYHEKHIQETRIKTTKEKLKKAFPLEASNSIVTHFFRGKHRLLPRLLPQDISRCHHDSQSTHARDFIKQWRVGLGLMVNKVQRASDITHYITLK